MGSGHGYQHHIFCQPVTRHPHWRWCEVALLHYKQQRASCPGQEPQQSRVCRQLVLVSLLGFV